MKKKALNNKLKLQKENIVNLNQLNSIKGGLKVNGIVYSDKCSVVGPDSAAPETETCFAF
ncbi:MAG: hypothetical protein GQ564_23215 [Bacteroidales bacterium]|nr:hypothetical protein [Bacteroidales bacterium]